jgi:protein-L-isoaspartate(D-aspartate) O-methyltransferase
MEKILQPNDSTSPVRKGLGEEEFARGRAEMIEDQLRRRGITDGSVLAAMAAVSRHEFVPLELRGRAYDDVPLPIGGGQTISQPYMVAAMTVSLGLKPSGRALEIGTGCGYQAAILSRLVKEVFTIERHPELAAAASDRLTVLGYANIHVHCGDGSLGLAQSAPFDAILVAAAAPAVPQPLLAQLADGGRLIVPIGDAENQELHLVEKQGNSFLTSRLEACRFVPLIGHHGWQEPPPK